MAFPNTAITKPEKDIIRVFCKCGQELQLTKVDCFFNHHQGKLQIAAKVTPCHVCLNAAKQTPEDWLPGFGAY